MEKNLFELATRHRYRFETDRGNLTVEDLWALPLEDIDAAYQGYASALRTENEDSLLTKPDKQSELLANKRDLLVHIFRAKEAEAQARLEQRERREKAARIRELIAQKQDESLAGKSEEELQELLNGLD